MKTVKDYKVKYKFGYSKAYGAAFHTGVDRPTPHGTVVLVNKTKIGLTGNTGYSTGPHHHLTRISAFGKLLNPRNSGFRLRTVFGRKPKVVKVGQDARNGKYVVIKNWQGHFFYHCHLSKIYVKVGQVVK